MLLACIPFEGCGLGALEIVYHMKTIDTARIIADMFNTLDSAGKKALLSHLVENTKTPGQVVSFRTESRQVNMRDKKESWAARVLAYAVSRKGKHWSTKDAAVALDEADRHSSVAATVHVLKKQEFIAHTGPNKYTLA